MKSVEEPQPLAQGLPHRERARVVAVEMNDEREFAHVWVEVFVKSTCGDCSASSTCGQGVLSRWFSRKRRCYPVECSREDAALLNVGRWVEVEIPDGALASVSLMVFVLPLLSMIVGALLFSAMNTSELGVALGGGLFFYLGMRAVRWLESSRWLSVPQPRLAPGASVQQL